MREKTDILLAILIILGINMNQSHPTMVAKVSGQPLVPYSLGNWTYIERPGYPAKVNATQIPRGENWTYVVNLIASCLYHVYFYGDWIDYGPLTNKTDYDLYVYNPLGQLETLHTESAGLPEHLGTTVEEPFFSPKYSGNYSFLIKNDLKESRGEKAATFVAIEHRECNQWYYQYLQGKVDNKPARDTSWVYEFVTSIRRIEVKVEVPDTLDMYEAQLYLMATPSNGMGALLNGVPLAWEHGLYGETDPSGKYGGYRVDKEGFRHSNASASCEFPGQDMLINYAAPADGLSLYHLALIAENGEGTVRFMFRTDFEPPLISIQNPVEKVYSTDSTNIVAQVIENVSRLDRVLLSYATDDWQTWTTIEMSADQNQTYVGTIPRQPAGSTVRYKITASDVVGNTAEAANKYIVKDLTNMTLSLSDTVLRGGDRIVVAGTVPTGLAMVRLDYACRDLRISRQVPASAAGIFTDEFIPTKGGVWTVSATWPGDERHLGASIGPKNFTVEKTSTWVTCDANVQTIIIGGDVNITGSISPSLESMRVSLGFTKPDGSTIERYCYTSSAGSFELIFKPDSAGAWHLQAKLDGDDLRQPSSSDQVSFTVNDTWINQHKWYIVASAGVGVLLVLGAVLLLRGKEEEE